MPVIRISLRRNPFGRTGNEIRDNSINGKTPPCDHDTGLACGAKICIEALRAHFLLQGKGCVFLAKGAIGAYRQNSFATSFYTGTCVEVLIRNSNIDQFATVFFRCLGKFAGIRQVTVKAAGDIQASRQRVNKNGCPVIVHDATGIYDTIYVGYADCGTGGRLDAVCEELGVERLPGTHCYEFFAGQQTFAQLHDAEPGTFYLTDFLVKHFDRLVIKALWLDTHPELLSDYFGNYTRLIYLAQTDNPDLVTQAENAAQRLGLRFELCPTGYGELATSLVELSAPNRQPLEVH